MPRRPLGRKPATDTRHLARYGMTAQRMPTEPTPLIIGINWYTAFDDPVQDRQGHWWVVTKGVNWGTIRGGHCLCLKPPAMVDNLAWWHAYNQGQEGACVGYGTCRALTLWNRRLYDGNRLYQEAKRIDEFPGEDYDGTSVRAGLDVARTEGAWRIVRKMTQGPILADGIESNWWPQSIEQVAYCLDPASQGQSVLNLGYVVPLNSWGDDPTWGYPHLPRLSLDDLDTLLFTQGGDVTAPFDRKGMVNVLP